MWPYTSVQSNHTQSTAMHDLRALLLAACAARSQAPRPSTCMVWVRPAGCRDLCDHSSCMHAHHRGELKNACRPDHIHTCTAASLCGTSCCEVARPAHARAPAQVRPGCCTRGLAAQLRSWMCVVVVMHDTLHCFHACMCSARTRAAVMTAPLSLIPPGALVRPRQALLPHLETNAAITAQ